MSGGTEKNYELREIADPVQMMELWPWLTDTPGIDPPAVLLGRALVGDYVVYKCFIDGIIRGATFVRMVPHDRCVIAWAWAKGCSRPFLRLLEERARTEFGIHRIQAFSTHKPELFARAVGLQYQYGVFEGAC